MQKFFAVLKREYKKVVFTWTFVITTLLLPLISVSFVIVPMLIFSIEGDQTRIAIADSTGNIAPRLKEKLSPKKIAEKAKRAAADSIRGFNVSQEEKLRRSADQHGSNFVFVDYNADAKSTEQIKLELNAKIAKKELEAYLIIPSDYSSKDTEIEYFSRKAGDFVINATLEDAVNESVRSQRLADANISEERLKEISRKVSLRVSRSRKPAKKKEKRRPRGRGL